MRKILFLMLFPTLFFGLTCFAQNAPSIDAAFKEEVEIFYGFAKLVSKHINDPAIGAQACQKYAQENVPRIKEINILVHTNPDKNRMLRILENTELTVRVGDVINTILPRYGKYQQQISFAFQQMDIARHVGAEKFNL